MFGIRDTRENRSNQPPFPFSDAFEKLSCQVTYVPEDDDEKEGASRQTTHGFAPGDVFMVFEYVDYDLSGLLKCRDVVCV